MNEKEITFKYQNNTIHGLLTTHENTRPLVVLLHGMTADKHRHGLYDQLAQALVDAGFCVGRIDVSGRGESSGEFQDTSVSLQAAEVSAFLDRVSSESFVDSSRIGAFGHSLGTSVILCCDSLFSARVLSANIVNPFKVIPQIFEDNFNRNGMSTRMTHGREQRLDSQFWDDLESIDFSALYQKDIPTLCILGERDMLRDMDDSLSEEVDSILLEGADHGMVDQWDEVVQITVDWFSKYL